MIKDIAYFGIGFSLLSAVILVLAHLLSSVYVGIKRARIFGILLMLNLCVLQLLHYQSLSNGVTLWASSLYVSNLFCTAPLFYFFCRAVLFSSMPEPLWKFVLVLPVLVAVIFPGEKMFFASFFIGTCYFAVLAYELIGLRSQRKRFYVEMVSLVMIFIIASMTLVLGVLMPLISHDTFVAGYAILVGLSFMPAMFVVIRYPDIVSIAEEAMAYASSTLSSVNVDRKIEDLNRLMLVERFYMDENLSLTSLAQQLGLTSHQTSELLNQKLGIGFSRYIRQLRVGEAKRQLAEDPQASVLSIGLNVGFTSQSSFYTAFKEEEGISPGQFRKQPANG